MSDFSEQVATHKAMLKERIVNVNIPKSEAEWWANGEIKRLKDRIEKLETALLPMYDAVENFIIQEDCLTNDEHRQWLEILSKAVAALERGDE